MAKKGPCFKDLWDLARLGQVCATGERCSSIHWPLSWSSCPMQATTTGSLTVESQESGPEEQLGSFMWSTPFALPDTNPHRNAMYSGLCFILPKKEEKLQARNVAHNFRIKTKNHNTVSQGLPDSPMGRKFPRSQIQCILGSRSRFLNFQRHCVWVRGVTDPPADQRGHSVWCHKR